MTVSTKSSALRWVAALALLRACMPSLAQTHAAPAGMQAQHAAHGAHGDHAHQSDYVTMTGREIKALSSQQTEDLLQGKGMGLSLPAELNKTPGPVHLLEMRETLGLDQAQTRQLDNIVQTMRADAIALGQSIVQAEKQLDLQFKQGKASAASVDAQTRKIALLTGQLRAVHLKAHLQASALLSAAQIAEYDTARGYGTSSAGLQDTAPLPQP
jgi:hypothetical protein